MWLEVAKVVMVMWKAEDGRSALTEPGTQQVLLNQVHRHHHCLFILPIFLDPLLGAKDPGRNKAQKLPLFWGSVSWGDR